MDEPECPLCLEPLGLDDLNFYPCACRYQICRFCWHRIRTDEGGRCPHCRTIYSENPAEYNPPTSEQITKLKAKGKKKNQDKKQKIVESRKSLSDVRVVQKNLVFVLGLSPRLADPEILKKQEYFGKYGKIYKVVINHHTVYNGTLGPSVSAYVTYQKEKDALTALLAVNNAFIDGRFLKASFGTTKYCSYFLRGLQCTKPDCMYLHELGDTEASFTKEDMQQGKHQDYEIATLESVPLTKESPIKKSFTSGKSSKQSSHSKTSSCKVTQQEMSALPSSSNWGSKSGPHPSSHKVQKQLSVPHNVNQTRLLQRTHSHPPRCHGNDNAHSRSTSPESITSSLGSTQGGMSADKMGVVCNGRRLSAGTTSSSSDNTSERDYENEDCSSGSQSWQTNEINRPHLLEEAESVLEPERGEVWEDEEGEEKENWDQEEKENWDEEKDTVDVFKSLGVRESSNDFGSLGVSWKGEETDVNSETRPSPIFMSLPWEVPHKETSTLVDLLAGKRTQSSPPQSGSVLVNERERLASASYVNYGPTTNNPLEESQLVKGTPLSHQSSSIGHHDGKGDSLLRTTFEDGFKSLFPRGGMQSLTLENALQVSSLPSTTHQASSTPSSSKLFGLFQTQSVESKTNNDHHLAPSSSTHNSTAGTRTGGEGRYRRDPNTNASTGNDELTTEWPKLNSSGKSTIKSDIAPPPGFGHHKPSPPSYSLWGGGGGGVNGLQGFIQHQPSDPSTVPVSAPGSHITRQKPTSTQRPVPAGLIPHNVLEASLFNAQTSGSYNNGGGIKRTVSPATSLTTQQQQQLLIQQQQQRAMALRQQQQQQYQKALMQQQMLLYQQQQQMIAQQQQKNRLANTTGGGQQTSTSNYNPSTSSSGPPSNGGYKMMSAGSQQLNSKDYPPTAPPPTGLYFGGWYPYAWGVSPPTHHPPPPNITGNRLVPPPPSAVPVGSSNGGQTTAQVSLERKFQNMTFNNS